MSLNYVQTNTLYLAGSGVIIGATSITLTTLTDIYANVLTMASFGAEGYITLEPDTTNEESATFTGIIANANGTYTLTGVKTTLAQTPYTETSGLVRQHSGGTKVVITDNVAFWATFGNKKNDETLIGRWGTAVAPLSGNDLVNKTYADGLAIAGAPDSSTTTKGIGRVSVAPVSPTIPIFVGDNDPRVPTQGENDAQVGNNTDVAVGTGNKFVTQTGSQHGAETYTIDTSGSSTAYVATYAPAFTSLTDGMVLRVKLVNANTTTSPTFAPNSLTAHTIVKLGGTALAVGDISANMLCTLVYDLSNTRWVLQNPVNATLYQEYIFTSTGTFTVPRGVTSVLVDIVGAGGGGGGTSNVTGAAGGGGGGQGAFNVSSNVTALTALTVTIGAGGTSGSNAGSNGGTGGTTSFNGISKTGGIGGTGSTGSTGQAGGASGDSTGGTGGTGGSTSASGSNGGTGTGGGSGGTGGVNSGTNGGGGGGGASGIGATGGNGGTGIGGNGAAGIYGSGGGGGSNQGTGGLGGAGLVIIKVPLSQII